jgi:hypothetical protein
MFEESESETRKRDREGIRERTREPENQRAREPEIQRSRTLPTISP